MPIRTCLKLIVSLFTLTLFACGATYSPVYAEVEQNTTLVVTKYDTTDDFDTLLANSKRVLAFYSGKEVDRPVMLHIVTREQQQAIKAKGYILEVIQQNPDMEQYWLFYLVVPGEVDKLSRLGKVYPLSKQYALVKIGEGKTVGAEIRSLKVMPAPFLDIVVPTNKKIRVQTSPPHTPQTTNETAGNNNALLAGMIAFMLIPIGASVGYVIYRMKKQANADPDNLYNDLPEQPLPPPGQLQ